MSDHILFDLEGLTTRMVRGDGLHIIFVKGIYAHLLGSVLHYMCWHEPPGTVQRVSPCKRVGLIFQEVQKEYKARGTECTTRMTNLKLKMFTDPDHPHASHAFLSKAKGGEAKHLAPALLAVCRRMLDESIPCERDMVQAMAHICRVVQIFDAGDIYLTAAQHAEAMAEGTGFLRTYSSLNAWAQGVGRNIFHVTIKFHTFWHLIENAKYLNPRFHWCFKSALPAYVCILASFVF